MRKMREYKRFKLDVIDLSSRICTVGKVEIIDISMGGVALKADRKLNIGKECLLLLGYEGRHINVKGIVVRSELSGIAERAEEGKVTVYSVGILFNHESGGKVKDFLDSIESNKKTQVPAQVDWFCRDVRFSITTPSEQVLNMPFQFGVKEISQSDIIIQTDHQLNIDSMVLMELSLSAYDPVSFMGKVISCRKTQDKANASYDIGLEFSELINRDRLLLTYFIDCIKDRGNTVKGVEIGKDNLFTVKT